MCDAFVREDSNLSACVFQHTYILFDVTLAQHGSSVTSDIVECSVPHIECLSRRATIQRTMGAAVNHPWVFKNLVEHPPERLHIRPLVYEPADCHYDGSHLGQRRVPIDSTRKRPFNPVRRIYTVERPETLRRGGKCQLGDTFGLPSMQSFAIR